MRVKLGSCLLSVLLISTMVGCAGTSSAPPVTVTLDAISVTPSASSIAFGTTQQFKAMGSFSDGSSQDITSSVTWSSSDNTIATISGSGLATPVKHGLVTIKATKSGINGSTGLTITTVLSSIAVSPGAPAVNVGASTQFTATGTYEDNTAQDITNSVTWSSSDSTKATISNTGLASGIKGGQTTIKATSGSISGSTLLSVNAVLMSITLTPNNPGVFVGSTLQFSATGNYNDSTNQDLTSSVTWSSSDDSKATVDNTGLASGVKGGVAKITATLGSVNQSADLNVTALLQSITLSPIGPGILVDGSQQFSATGHFNDATTLDLTSSASWSSSDTGKATVDSAGLATGDAVGAVTITATRTSADGSIVIGSTALDVVTPFATPPTLNGNYAFTLMSADTRGPQLFAGSFHANPPDGNGHGTIDSGVEDANTGAGVFIDTLPGSYIIYPDGRGNISFGANAIHPSGITLRFILAASATNWSIGKLAQFDGQGTAKGTLEVQDVSAFNAAALNGNYVFRASGIDSGTQPFDNGSAQPMGQVGVFATDGVGTITGGNVDTDDFANVSGPAALTPSGYSVDTNGRGTMQFVTASGTATFALYVVSSNRVNMIQIDAAPASALAGVAELQANQVFKASDLVGGYAFLIDRPVVVGTNGNFDRREFAQVGGYKFDGVDAITGVRDDTNNGSLNPLTDITGGYAVSGLGINGRGTLRAISVIGQSDRSYVFYMVSASKMFVLQNYTSPTLGSFNAPTGVAELQTGWPYGKNTLAGSYALDASDLTATYTEALMRLSFDGSGSIQGIADVAANATVSSAVISASYSGFNPNPDTSSGRGGIDLTDQIGARNYIFYLVSPEKAWVLGVTPPEAGTILQQ
jgi:uncharacterized protein YjdB